MAISDQNKSPGLLEAIVMRQVLGEEALEFKIVAPSQQAILAMAFVRLISQTHVY